jgi:uncharacterized protein with ParB-like and HNH nuclease domain
VIAVVCSFYSNRSTQYTVQPGVFMKAEECKVQQILTENKKYTIPSYQRPYSWTKEETMQLILDINDSCHEQNREYFIGSMICIKKGNNEYEVVDGQQRLTTLSLILTSLRNLIEKEKIKQDLEKRILPIDPYSDEYKEPRLKVRDNEYHLYHNYILQGNSLYKPKEPTYTENLFIENFNVINEYLSQKEQSELGQIAKYIQQCVSFVFVETDDLMSSFRLFNVLNNRGMSLSIADLLKNLLFQKVNQSNECQTKAENLWFEIEHLVGVENLNNFLNLYKLSEKKVRDRVLHKDYQSYIDEIKNEFNNNAILFLENLFLSAQIYQQIKENAFECHLKPIKKHIKSLSYLELDEAMPPILAILKRQKKHQDFTNDQLINFVIMYEKIYTQGWLKKQIKSKREMVIYSALVSINNGHSYQEIMNAIQRHADNEATIGSIQEPIYDKTSNMNKLIKAIFFRIEDDIHDDHVEKNYHGRITIEHILPQKSNDLYWKDRFSEQEKNDWVHKLGNLMLLSGTKNSEAQNYSFDRKKTIYENRNKSSFELTKQVSLYHNWNIQTLKERQSYITRQVEKFWLV